MSGLLKDRGLNSVVFIVDDDGFLPRSAGDFNQRLQAAGYLAVVLLVAQVSFRCFWDSPDLDSTIFGVDEDSIFF